MASFRKRMVNGKARWDVTVTKQGVPRQTRTFATRGIADRWATEQERFIDQGADVAGIERAKNDPLETIIERYLREEVIKLGSPQHARSCSMPLTRDLGRIAIGRLTPERVVQYREDRLKQRALRGGGRKGQNSIVLNRLVSTSTIKKEMAFLARIVDFATKNWGYRLPFGNPARGVDRPPEGPGRDRRLVGDEARRLLGATAANHIVSNVITLAIETAARRGELCAMDWRDIDYEARTATIRAEELGAMKTGIARVVPLSLLAVETLQKMRRPATGGRIIGLTPDALSSAFERACARAGISGLRFHDLRHEGTSRLFELGLSMMEVAAITGHKTLDMLKRYTQLRAEQIAKRMDVLTQAATQQGDLGVQITALLQEVQMLRRTA
ncbi:MAG: Tyrosine recombinase XerC [Hydrocarboniphaga sp.]|uniref:tyrosine-type recombinase/integrase n=1 Tax=Hydrocarboniphaga sp. TaxID=2033016 RepID=UPI00261E98D8|nr:site-specific integrase [Hydrocarboniphaga sp.]MDB5967883.1 Tyrosine recombinase XerC [Hydrocarboniphaga sp.]